jgi:hypothetical protein
MTLEERLIETLRELPMERRGEVLDFAEFLKRPKPVALEPRPFGLCAGEFEVPADFDAMLPEAELQEFEQ